MVLGEPQVSVLASQRASSVSWAGHWGVRAPQYQRQLRSRRCALQAGRSGPSLLLLGHPQGWTRADFTPEEPCPGQAWPASSWCPVAWPRQSSALTLSERLQVQRAGPALVQTQGRGLLPFLTLGHPGPCLLASPAQPSPGSPARPLARPTAGGAPASARAQQGRWLVLESGTSDHTPLSPGIYIPTGVADTSSWAGQAAGAWTLATALRSSTAPTPTSTPTGQAGGQGDPAHSPTAGE